MTFFQIFTIIFTIIIGMHSLLYRDSDGIWVICIGWFLYGFGKALVGAV